MTYCLFFIVSCNTSLQSDTELVEVPMLPSTGSGTFIPVFPKAFPTPSNG